MTRAAKQWATTGFIIGVGSGIAIVVIAVILMRGTPAVAASAPTAPATAAKTLLAGTINLDPTVAAKVSGPSIVFVIARTNGSKGHPLLAKRLDVSRFPANFVLGAEDSMSGGDVPSQVTLEVRVDRDGDAMTKEPGDPIAVLQNVPIGRTDLSVTLR